MSDKIDIVKYKFIGLGMLFYIAMFLLNKLYSISIIENIFSTLGSLFLVTGIFDVWLKKSFFDDIATHIIDVFFAKALDGVKTTEVIKNTKKSIDHLSSSLHKDIREKFKNRVSRYFIDIFSDEKRNLLDTFYSKYSLTIVINKKEDNKDFLITNYKLSYTLINNINDEEVSHAIFKIRGMSKDFVEKEKNILDIKELEIVADGRKIDIDVSNLKTEIVDIPENSSINNKDKILAISLRYKDKPKEEIKINFKNKLKVTKAIDIKTELNDIIYICHFNKISTNIDINFIDENAKDIHILSGFAFIDKEDIEIKDIQNNNKSIKINDLIFPNDKINFISER